MLKTEGHFALSVSFQSLIETSAKNQYKLNDKEMDTLQYEEHYNPITRHKSKVFSLPKVQALSMRKHGRLPDTVLHELH